MARLMLTRENWISEDHEKFEDDQSTAIVYKIHDRAGRPCATGFSGRRNKPDFNYFFKSEERREAHIIDFFNQVRSREADKKKRQQEQKDFKHTLKTGDILYSSWGYEQTNIDFYQVVNVVSDKTVEICEIAGIRDYTGDMTGTVVPDKDNFIGSPFRKRVTQNNWIRLDSCSGCGLYDGRPKYWSSYA